MMHSATSSTPSATAVIIFSAFVLLLCETRVEGCFGGSPFSQRHGRAKSISSSTSDRHTSSYNAGRIYELNHGEVFSTTPNISVRKGDLTYGKILVPWAPDQWTLTVAAHWSGSYSSTPMWFYIKQSGLPSTSDWDKTGISFMTRQYSRIRVDHASPGPYFVMVEALEDIRNVTISVSILPVDHAMAGQISWSPDYRQHTNEIALP